MLHQQHLVLTRVWPAEVQVEVARLTLELKEAEMQRDDAEAYKATQQQTINSLQVGSSRQAGPAGREKGGV